MPKMKTHSGAKKRFRITGTGKITRRRANRAHYLEHKPSTKTRRLANYVTLSPPCSTTSSPPVCAEGSDTTSVPTIASSFSES